MRFGKNQHHTVFSDAQIQKLNKRRKKESLFQVNNDFRMTS